MAGVETETPIKFPLMIAIASEFLMGSIELEGDEIKGTFADILKQTKLPFKEREI